MLDLGQANAALILASIGQEADAEEAEDHHRPCGGLGNGTAFRKPAATEPVAPLESQNEVSREKNTPKGVEYQNNRGR